MPVPEQIAPIWNVINESTVTVHAYWFLFNQLFGKSQEQIDLLNDSASFFFYVVRDALATEIQLRLAKLCDPAEGIPRKRGTDTNATVQHLLQEIGTLNVPELATELDRLYAAFAQTCKPMREQRNKVIAHLDRDIAFRKVEPPPATTVAQINRSLNALASFMNAISLHFEQSETGYEYFIMSGRDADALVGLLKMGLRYEVLQKEGTIPWDDPVEM